MSQVPAKGPASLKGRSVYLECDQGINLDFSLESWVRTKDLGKGQKASAAPVTRRAERLHVLKRDRFGEIRLTVRGRA